MVLFPVIFSLGLGTYLLYSGISDKPPFEAMQDKDGWDHSRFPNRHWATGTGILFVGVAIFFLIK